MSITAGIAQVGAADGGISCDFIAGLPIAPFQDYAAFCTRCSSGMVTEPQPRFFDLLIDVSLLRSSTHRYAVPTGRIQNAAGVTSGPWQRMNRVWQMNCRMPSFSAPSAACGLRLTGKERSMDNAVQLSADTAQMRRPRSCG